MISVLTISAVVLALLLAWQVVDVIRLGSWQALREANEEEFDKAALALHYKLCAADWSERPAILAEEA